MSKYNYKGIIETQKKEKIIEEYMYFSSNELVEILVDRDLEIERLNNKIEDLEVLIELIYHEVFLNDEQQKLLNSIIIGGDKE